MASASLSALVTNTSSTRSGKDRVTWLTASRTSAAAVSRSLPGENSMRMRVLFSSLLANISVTPATRATALSRTLVTSASIVSGAAPGKVALTVTMGRSTSGSSRTSSPKSAAIPARTMRMFSTPASSGRRTERAGKPRSVSLIVRVLPRR